MSDLPVAGDPAEVVPTTEQPPRVWWDGKDFLYLKPGPLLDQEGHEDGPELYRAGTAADIPTGAVELEPAPDVPIPLELYGISGHTDAIADKLTGEPAWTVNLAGRLLREAADLLPEDPPDGAGRLSVTLTHDGVSSVNERWNSSNRRWEKADG